MTRLILSNLEKEGKGRRLLSLDVFRGMTIAAMILVNNPGSWDTVYSPLKHAQWHGCTPTDFIFPFFLFIVGVSIPFSLNKFRNQPELHGTLIFKIVKRVLVLFLIGIFLNAFPYFEWSTLRIPGVLQRIAIVFGIGALLYLKLTPKVWLGISIMVLGLYWGLLTLVPLPDGGESSYLVNQNLVSWVDYQLLEGHMWATTKTWDPEGVLSTLPAVVTALIGMGAGHWLNTEIGVDVKGLVMFFVGNVMVLTGLVWGIWFPLNKNLWTSSFVLYTGGIALVAFSVLYWLLDSIKRGIQYWKPFKMFGTNALFAYVLSMLLGITFSQKWLSGGESVQIVLFKALGCITDDPYLASLVYAIGFTFMIFLPLWGLYRKGIIIKV